MNTKRTIVVHALLICSAFVVWPESTLFGQQPHLYWVDGFNAIQRSDLDGGNLTELYDASNNLGNIAIDEVKNDIYWSSGSRVQRLQIATLQQNDVVSVPNGAFRGDVAIDRGSEAVFHVDGRNNVVYRSSLDGSGSSVVIPANGTPSNTSGFSDLALDRKNEQLYWSNNGTFQRSKYDGSNIEFLFSFAGIVDDFEIDFANDKIYWASRQAIRRANLDGSGSELLVSGLQFANGIALDHANEKVYFTDSWFSGPRDYDATIQRMNFDGSDRTTLLNLGPSVKARPREIIIATLAVPEPTTATLGVVIAATICLRRRRIFS